METRTTFHRGDKRLETRLDGEGDAKKIVGYAAVYYDGTEKTEYELWRGVRERILPGAFDEAVAEDDVRALFNHDPNQILGRTSSGTCQLATDAVGLRYEIDPPDTQCGRDTKVSLGRRDVTGSSFSFAVLEENWLRKEDGTEIRELVKLRLYDVGPVTFPAYEATTAGVRAQRSDGGVDEARARRDAWHAARDLDAVDVDARWAEITSQL